MVCENEINPQGYYRLVRRDVWRMRCGLGLGREEAISS